MLSSKGRRQSLLYGAAMIGAAVISLAAVRYPVSRTLVDSPSLTIYMTGLAVVRQALERPLAQGTHTVRIEDLPSNLDRSSLIVLNSGVTLLGAHGFRTYQDASYGSGASLDLDLRVEETVETLRIAFLSNGLSWSSAYTVVVSRDDRSARMDGFATIANNAGTDFQGAEVQLMAGTIQRGRSSGLRDFAMRAVPMEADEAPSLGREAFGDYHAYTVSDPLTLRSGESRRIRLLGGASLRARKVYTLTHNVVYHQPYQEAESRPVAVSYHIQRPLDSELGAEPLPGGQVNVYQEDQDGRIQLLGISAISNTPKGQDLQLPTGFAFDVTAERTQTDFSRPAPNVYETAWRIELENASDRGATVQVIEQLSGDWSIVQSSHEAEKLSATAVRFGVEVPAGGTSTLEYRVSVRG